MFVEAGLTPAQALRSPTSESADFVGDSDRGMIAEGRVADFLVLIGDPLEDIRNTQMFSTIILAGNVTGVNEQNPFIKRFLSS